jgi:hypothetical protein
MTLTNSWPNHFIEIGNSNEANKNMAFFSNTMKPDQTKSEKIINLVEENNTVALVIGKAGQIMILHSFKKIGGTRTRPTLKVSCFFENGAKAAAIFVDTDQITALKEIMIPSGNAILKCNTIKELRNIENPQIQPTPAATSTARATRQNT